MSANDEGARAGADDVRSVRICPTIVVPRKLVPWSAPLVVSGTTKAGKRFRGARKEPRLVAFQADVRRKALAAMDGRDAATGPVRLDLILARAVPKCRTPGAFWAASPDLTNLQKAIEDACNGVVWADDRQVCVVSTVKVYARQDGCRIDAYTLEYEGMEP